MSIIDQTAGDYDDYGNDNEDNDRWIDYSDDDATDAAPVAEFVTDYSAPADSAFELLAAEYTAYNEFIRLADMVDDAARRKDRVAYAFAIDTQRIARRWYLAASKRRAALYPNRAVIVQRVSARRYTLVWADNNTPVANVPVLRSIKAARECADRRGVSVAFVSLPNL